MKSKFWLYLPDWTVPINVPLVSNLNNILNLAGLLGEALQDANKYGWQVGDRPKHDWGQMVQAIQDYIGGLNWGYKVELRDKSVKYINAYGYIQDKNTIKTTNKRGKEEIITADKILVATGERPRYPSIPGVEHCIRAG